MSRDVGEIEDSVIKVQNKAADPKPKGLSGKKLRKVSQTSVNRDTAFLQKKVADLEIAISELQETAQKVDMSQVEGLKQKIEDIEDLTMVENAGVIEIKKFLENLQSQNESSLPQQLEERINSLQQKIDALPDLSQLEAKISETKTDMPELTELQNSLQMTKDEVENKLNEINSKFEEKLSLPLQEKVLKEMEDIKNESLVNNSKVDAIDSFVKEMSKEVNKLKPFVDRVNGKIESFEKLGGIEAAIDDKIKEFREILTTAENLEDSNEHFKEINSTVLELKGMENKMKKMVNSVADFDKKFEILESQMDDVNNKENEIVSLRENVTSIRDLISSFDKKVGKVHGKIKSLEGDLSILQGSQMAVEARSDKLADLNISELMKRISSLEQVIEVHKPHHDRIDKLEKKIDNVETKSSGEETSVILNEILNRLVFLESRVVALEKTMVSGSTRPIIIE